MTREVVITGIGLILPNCDDRQTFWRQLKSGESQLELISNPASPQELIPAGRINQFSPDRYLAAIPKRYRKNYSRLLQHYLAALFLARDDAGFSQATTAADRIAIYDGSSRGTIAFWQDKISREKQPAERLYTRKDIINGLNGATAGVAAALLKTEGPTISFSGSCCSGLMAVGQAFRDIRSGVIDAAFASGYDEALTPGLFASYRETGITSSEKSCAAHSVKPYANEPSLVFGEGVVTLLLEERRAAERRGAYIIAKITGYTQGNEGRNPYRSGANPERCRRLLQKLYDDADRSSAQTDFFVGHGNGVPSSDISEIKFFRDFYGDLTEKIPLISVKPIYGHLIGGSSSINIAAAALMLHHRYIVPTLNAGHLLAPISGGYDHRGRIQPDCSLGVAFSWGMGGNIAALLLEKT